MVGVVVAHGTSSRVDDVVVAVSLASALARVAWAEASVAWADSTVALRAATSREARVWPAVTVWPTDDVDGADRARDVEVEVGLVDRRDGAHRVEGGLHGAGTDRRRPIGGRRAAGQVPGHQGRRHHHHDHPDPEGREPARDRSASAVGRRPPADRGDGRSIRVHRRRRGRRSSASGEAGSSTGRASRTRPRHRHHRRRRRSRRSRWCIRWRPVWRW